VPEWLVVERLAAAVGDGRPVQWDTAGQLVADEDERRVVSQLESISRLVPPALASEAAPPAVTTIGGLLWSAALGLAVVQVVVGLASAAIYGNVKAFRYFSFDVAATVVFGLAALLLAWNARRDDRARRLGWLYLLIATAFAQTLIGMSGVRASTLIAPFVLGLYPESFLGYATWLFAAEFPRTSRFSRFDRWFPTVGAAAALVSLFLFVVSWVAVRFSGTDWPPFMQSLLAFERSKFGYWYAVWLLMLPAMASSAWRVRRAPSLERRRVRWFTGALVVGIAPLLLLAIALSTSATVRGIMTSSGTSRLAIEIVTLGLVLSVPFTTAYAIVTQRTLSVRLAIREGIRYGLTRTGLTMLVTLPLVVPIGVALRHRNRSLDDLLALPDVRLALAALAAGVLLAVFRRSILARADRVLGYARADWSRDLAAATGALAHGRTGREIAGELERQIVSGIGAPGVVVLFQRAQAFEPVIGNSAPLGLDAALAALLHDEPVVSLARDSTLYPLLPADDRSWLAQGEIELMARLAPPGGPLDGIVGVVRRRHGFAYTEDDAAFVAALATAAGMVVHRIRQDVRFEAAETPADELGALECSRCGTVAAAATCACHAPTRPAALPARLGGKIDVIRRLGSGGMGVVYLGRDVRLDRDVALKTLPRASSSAIDAMLAEARAMARVEHPHLALIYDVHMWRGAPVLVVEYLANGTLHDRLARDGKLSADAALTVGAALAGALDALHARGITHRDVKPGNVGFSSADTPKLLDFGVAVLREHAADNPYLVGGTPLYMSPELLAGGVPVPSDDVWALGIVLVQALTGRHPFSGRSVAEIRRRMLSRPSVLFDDRALQEWWFERALHPIQERRPQSAGELIRELRSHVVKDHS